MIFIVLLSGPSHSAIVHNLFLVPIGASFCFIFYFQQTDYKLYKLTVWRNGKFLVKIMRCWTQWGVLGPPGDQRKFEWKSKTHFFNFCWYLCQLSALEKTKIHMSKVTFLFILSFILESLFNHACTMN